MSEQTIRPYSMLIYGLQDDFISVLKPQSLESKGHIINPKMVLKNDGTQELTFSIPMYYTDTLSGQRIINPLWAKTRNSELLANLRKIKVVMGEGEVFEFVINSKIDRHSGGTLECEIKANGLPFRELGGTGYKLSLTQDDFLVEYNKWADEDGSPETEPHMSIDYWCKKVFDGSTAWQYRIDMNWDAFIVAESDEERAENNTKIFEDEYINDWDVVDGKLIPLSKESYQEKYRAIDCKESNRYNITQDIAKAFGVYCRYEYTYDDEYHIIKRTAVFYNNYFQEEDNIFDINYPHQTSEVTRDVESSDVVTKMYVKDVEDADQVSGIISISDAAANKSGEDYILNFEYLKAVGSITDEQYEAVAEFEAKMHDYNKVIANASKIIADDQAALPEYQAEAANANEGVKKAAELIEEAQMKRDSILGIDGIVTRGTDKGGYSISSILNIATTTVAESSGYPAISDGYTYRINIITTANANDSGIIADSVHLYYLPTTTTTEPTLVGKEKYKLVTYKDSNGYTDIIGADLTANAFEGITSKQLYWSYKCAPYIKYDKIISVCKFEAAQQNKRLVELNDKIANLQNEIETYTTILNVNLEGKNQELAYFQRLMGPAIREGNWQDDSYKDYGKKIVVDGVTIDWDDELFDGEDYNYQKPTIGEDTNHYYPFAILDLSKLKNVDLSKLFLCYDVPKSIKSSEKDGEETFTPTEKNQIITHRIGANAGFVYQFIKRGSTIYAAIVITECDAINFYKNNLTNYRLCTVEEQVLTTTTKEGLTEYTYEVAYIPYEGAIGEVYFENKEYTTVYPRYFIKDETFKTSEDKITLRVKSEKTTEAGTEQYYETFKKYSQYTVLNRATEGWAITIVPQQLMHYAINALSPVVWLSYELSNACTSLYLDALEVMKTNAYPKISYTVTLSKLPENTLKQLYKYLNHIVHINDSDLFLDEVQGYISEITMNLDAPWDDTITTKDYKTKFEDLFSAIVASTEQMKSNGAAYDAAAAAFSVSGSSTLINEATLQHSINKYNLTQQFDQGTLTMSNENGIWATSSEGVVAMTGGGIFCATEKDAMGQWIWHTGLTPVGINASMITTGHLDTNLVNIFSGDNIALQLNKNGLFAYKSNVDSDGKITYSPNTYVVHNENGLFFTDDNIDKVEISWNGLVLRNNTGKELFYINNKGQVVGDQFHIDNAFISSLEVGDLKTASNYIKVTPQNGHTFFDENGVIQNLNFIVQLNYIEEVDAKDIFMLYLLNQAGEWENVASTESYEFSQVGTSRIYTLKLIPSIMGTKLAQTLQVRFVKSGDKTYNSEAFEIYAASEEDIFYGENTPDITKYKLWVNTAEHQTYYRDLVVENVDGETIQSYQWIAITSPNEAADWLVSKVNGEFTLSDNALTIVKDTIRADANNIILVAQEKIETIVGDTSFAQTAETLSTQVGEHGTVVKIQEDGVTISKNYTEDEADKYRYSVHIEDTGLAIQRAENATAVPVNVSRFRKTQLTARDLRISAPTEEEDSKTHTSIREYKGGVIFVAEKAVLDS